MSGLTVEQRGDLAEEMLPVAAHLAVLVHGEGGPEDVRQVLDGLDETQKDALIVVLAGLVDPEQPVGKALGWLDFTEHGALTVPASWFGNGSVRDLVADVDEPLEDDFVDPVAVARFVKGFRVDVSDAEFLAAVQQCVAMEMTLSEVDVLRGWPKKTAEKRVNRMKKRYQRSGREFPSLAQPSLRTFSEPQVIAIREQSLAGGSDVELGMSYGVSRETIRAIVTGLRYAEFGGPIRSTRSERSLKASREHMCGHADHSVAASFQAPNAQLSPGDRYTVGQRVGAGEDVKGLAAEYEVSTTTIRRYAA